MKFTAFRGEILSSNLNGTTEVTTFEPKRMFYKLVHNCIQWYSVKNSDYIQEN